jgi:hypothetical protein
MRPGAHLKPSALMDAVGYAAGIPFAIAAAARGGKAVHPHGAVHEATIVIAGGDPAPRAATLLREPGEHRALVRFSRSLGLPRPLPDLLGMSIRMPDVHGPGRHQDFMLVTSADLPVVHHGFLPAADVWQRPYSSSLPYRSGGERFIVGALPDPDGPRPDGEHELARLDKAARTGELRFALAVAAPMGRFRPVGEIRVGARLPDELDAIQMNPFNCGGGLEPAGFLNRLRDYAYPLSQAGWRIRQGVPADASRSSDSSKVAGSGAAR